VIPLMCWGRWRRGRARAPSARGAPRGRSRRRSAALYGVATFTALSAGAFLPARSPGALDDGGACAVLVRVAEELAKRPPPARTDVELLLLSAEEVGVQGSWAYAAQRFAGPPDLPTFVVNLEGIAYAERFRGVPTLRLRFDARVPVAGPATAALRRLLERTAFGGSTDARSPRARHPCRDARLARARRRSRGLHSARDTRARLDEAALESSVAFLLDLVSAADAQKR
jgi:Zn-dependent M28 family amino/carboxypeptidase